MIDALKAIIGKEIKAAEVKTEPKAQILKIEDNTQTTKLPKPSK